ncbi:MAG: S41 family peptidase [Gemmatimonadaceae bacterium]
MRRVHGPVTALLLVALVAPVVAPQGAPTVTRARTAAEDLQLFSQVFNQIRVNHPDSIDSHRLFMAAIQAMVRATDPHSYVIPAVRLEPGKEAQLRAGRLHPVPITFAFVGGSAVVVSVGAGTDASRRDILAGDELVAFDGQPMRAESALELEITLAGPRGSTVDLTFERRRLDGTYASLMRRVRRERYSEETAVPAAMMLDATTGYVRITTFDSEKVAADLRSALQRLERNGMQRLVLDLRQNGGGYVDEAATIAGEFLPTGTVVYTSEGRRASAVDTGRVKRSFWRSERQYPIIVLIDDGTASASELVAGALQDHDRALIVGQPSFGKSLMMTGFPLSDGSILVLVIGQIRTPCGRAVQRQYRDLTVRNYYRLALAERDTAGRPSCRTTSGRTVYGGGGIYPDVRTERPLDAPPWYRRLNELDVPPSWVGGFVTAQGNALGTLESFASAPALPAGTADAFRTFAAERGVEVPRSAADDARLDRLLLQVIAYAKWGNAGLYQVEARIDPDVTAAIQHFALIPARP